MRREFQLAVLIVNLGRMNWDNWAKEMAELSSAGEMEFKPKRQGSSGKERAG